MSQIHQAFLEPFRAHWPLTIPAGGAQLLEQGLNIDIARIRGDLAHLRRFISTWFSIE
ncbi:MAG: hypothetical protein H0W72_04600 [Planctomycetes bacterium]|nr:hypothetical protein [Planctomycetota bacterium]